MVGFLCPVLFVAFKKSCSKSYSMAFDSNCSTKPSNIVLLLEKKQMLTRLSKFSNEFPRFKGFGLITCVNIHSHTRVLAS